MRFACRFVFATFLMLMVGSTYAQSQFRWFITDYEEKPLAGATIVVSGAGGQILISDDEGRASLQVSEELLIFQVSYVGMQTVIDTVNTHKQSMMRVKLLQSDAVLDEVEVSGNKSEDAISQLSSGYKMISAEKISVLPFLMGERDPIKFIQTQPGVSNGTDGNNGYYVRGGGIDQNMISLDRMELYNANHLFGFFSMFNMEAIDRVEYYKSGYSSKIGGRLSSSMLIHTKQPNTRELAGSVSAGLLSAGLSLEVPVVKEKSSLLVAARRSYLDLITQNLFSSGSNLRRKTDYRFSDFIIKYQHQLGSKDIFSFTTFGGGDDYHYTSRRLFSNNITWSTYNAGVSWKHLFSSTTDLEFYASSGFYRQSFNGSLYLYEMDLKSNIRHLKSGLEYNHDVDGRHTTAGFEIIGRTMVPNEAELRVDDELFTLSEAPDVDVVEWGVFWDEEWDLSDRLRMGIGLRGSGFLQLGPFDRYLATDDGLVLDTVSYAAGKVIKRYFNLEPRVRFNYRLDRKSSLRFSYDRNSQYIHLSPISSVSLPTDVWVPSSQKIKPQLSDQFTVGYQKILPKEGMRFSADIYYKHLSNQVEYRNGAISGYSDSYNFDDDFVFGKGRSYGLELALIQDASPFSYEVSYTLSRTVRQFSEIQSGKAFPAKYDRTHDLNLMGTYPFGKWQFSGLFKLTSGNAITLPTSKYLIEGNVVSEYSRRNSFRLPIYHRLDLSATLTTGKKENALWIFSIYNVYNRKNPFYVYFEVEGNANEYRLDIDLQKVDLFPVLPSVSYQLKF